MKTKTNLKGGALTFNHNETASGGVAGKTKVKSGSLSSGGALRVKSAIKAGPIYGILVANNNETISGLRVKSAVKVGPIYGVLIANHNETLAGLRVKSAVKAGPTAV